MTLLRKTCVILLGLALVGTLFLGSAGRAAATQNGPSFSTGNRWAYAVTVFRSGSNHSAIFDVQEQTTVTIASMGYPSWHVKETVIQPTTGGTQTSWNDLWVTVDGVRVAKMVSAGIPVLGNLTTVYNPPSPQAVFPLKPGDSWSVPSTVTISSNVGSVNLSETASGIVSGEVTVRVPAGTFTAAEIRSPSSGNPYTVSYYSEQAGWFVRIDSFNGAGTLTNIQNLTSTNYSPGLFGISNTVWIVGLVIALIVIVAAVVFLRRRPRMPYGMPPQQPGQPYPPPPYPPPPEQGPPRNP